MKVVFDTNVYVSAALRPNGPPGRLVSAWYEERVEVVISQALLDEVTDVLHRQRIERRLEAVLAQRDRLLDRLTSATLLVNPTRVIHAITADPDDDRVLEAAIAGNVDYIVSGDQHLLSLGDFDGIPIIEPAVLLRILQTP